MVACTSLLTQVIETETFHKEARMAEVFNWTPQKKELALFLWDQGYAAKRIGREIGTSRETVRRFLEKQGIEVRSRFGGINHKDWAGGVNIDRNGYRRICIPYDHPLRENASRQMLEHRFIMASYLGRKLEPFETVHHINGDRQDNRIENLQLRVGNHGRGSLARCRCCGSSDIEFYSINENGE